MPDIPTIRILLVDDETLFRRALARLLQAEPGFEIVGEASNAEQAYRFARDRQPDVVLLDLRMPQVDGIETMRRLKAARPSLPVLILTSLESDHSVQDAVRSGAAAYLLKDSTPEVLAASIRSICAGGRAASPSVWDRMTRLMTGYAADAKTLDGLTPREIQIIRLVASGLANKQIAFQLRLSEKTVRNHISNIYEKLQVRDRAQAVLYAARKGLVQV